MNELTLHSINTQAIPAALEKASQYRSLLEPEQAESICLDILAVQPDNQDAKVILILAITDQFTHGSQALDETRVLDLIMSLHEEYERLYYRGLVKERKARALLHLSMSRSFAYDYFCKAMQLYEQAEKTSPEINADAQLRWNACLRTLRRERLQPRLDQDETHMDVEC